MSGKVRVDRSVNFSAIRFVTQNAIAIEADKGEKHPWANQLMVLPIDEARQVEAGEYVDIDFQYRAGRFDPITYAIAFDRWIKQLLSFDGKSRLAVLVDFRERSENHYTLSTPTTSA